MKSGSRACLVKGLYIYTKTPRVPSSQLQHGLAALYAYLPLCACASACVLALACICVRVCVCVCYRMRVLWVFPLFFLMLSRTPSRPVCVHVCFCVYVSSLASLLAWICECVCVFGRSGDQMSSHRSYIRRAVCLRADHPRCCIYSALSHLDVSLRCQIILLWCDGLLWFVMGLPNKCRWNTLAFFSNVFPHECVRLFVTICVSSVIFTLCKDPPSMSLQLFDFSTSLQRFIIQSVVAEP